MPSINIQLCLSVPRRHSDNPNTIVASTIYIYMYFFSPPLIKLLYPSEICSCLITNSNYSAIEGLKPGGRPNAKEEALVSARAVLLYVRHKHDNAVGGDPLHDILLTAKALLRN